MWPFTRKVETVSTNPRPGTEPSRAGPVGHPVFINPPAGSPARVARGHARLHRVRTAIRDAKAILDGEAKGNPALTARYESHLQKLKRELTVLEAMLVVEESE